MSEPWLLAQGNDDDGSFIVKLNGSFRKPSARVGFPTRLDIKLHGQTVMREIADEAGRGKLEDAFYDAAQSKGGVLAATVWRSASYRYIIYLPSGITGSEPVRIPEALRPHLTTTIAADVDWDEYCRFLEARVAPDGLINSVRLWWSRLWSKN